MKNLVFGIGSFLLLLSVLAGCQGSIESETGATGQEEVFLRIGHDSSADHPSNVALETFKENIESASEGRIKVEIFPHAQLGNAAEMMEQTRRGDLEMSLGATVHYTSIPEFQVFNSFYMFEDAPHAHRVLDGEAVQNLLNVLEPNGLTGIGFMEIGFRNFTNNSRPIETKEDVSGLRIRGYNPIQIKGWESLGVSLTSIDWAEMFTSLQQGLIDGQESATISFYDERFFEAQDYLSVTNHIYTPYLWYANKNFMESLSEDNKQLILAEASKAIDMQRDLMTQLEEETLAKLEQEGVQINEVSLEERDRMGEVMNEAIREDIISQVGSELYEEFMEQVEEERH
ncbi:TRAP transporter substrate-binding protein [Alkalihalobacillus oceani]|uniref:TRAP transporter substrate-binding protein n=1 Tax=Halalkalibacter oceani TaxID=1653776 RepID=A0A9X2DV56_9BACI|nr:TRAP transporter substrate-binding protein [Halalkalibacter oceani]MCM3716112.1 TRAP transporter substrate-binding protein [Halalkalibacter oceani]